MATFFTKSHFLSGLQCHKSLWLLLKEPQRASPPSPMQQRMLDQGQTVGELARQWFPDGQLIGGIGHAAIQATQTALAQAGSRQFPTGGTCLFEATFNCDGVLIRCDILHQTSATTWELVEVKSSTTVKEEHYWDVALQYYVLMQSGLNISATKLMHINSQDCCFPDLDNLFILVDISAEVKARLPEIPSKLAQFRTVLSQAVEPNLAIGKHCDQPNPCCFKQTCWQHIPDRSIFTIPRLDWKKKDALIAKGILAIADLPPTFRLTDNQQTYVDMVLDNQPTINPNAIATSLAQLEYPIHYFDFETHNPAIPRFNGLKPYEQFPFQYSCHILHADGAIEHREYLHTDPTDPRESLITTLTTDIASTGSVMVYHKSFEASLLRKLAADFPDFAPQLLAIAERLWDLEDIFKHHYKHPNFRGSTSIKHVLPVLVPNLSYNTLPIKRGDEAQAVWEIMIRSTEPTEKANLIADLRRYCQMDTLAMLEIYKTLTRLIDCNR